MNGTQQVEMCASMAHHRPEGRDMAYSRVYTSSLLTVPQQIRHSFLFLSTIFQGSQKQALNLSFSPFSQRLGKLLYFTIVCLIPKVRRKVKCHLLQSTKLEMWYSTENCLTATLGKHLYTELGGLQNRTLRAQSISCSVT